MDCKNCERPIEKVALDRVEKFPSLHLEGLCSTCQRDFVARKINHLRVAATKEARADQGVKRGKKLFRRMPGETTPSSIAKTFGLSIAVTRAWLIETGLLGEIRSDPEDGYLFVQIEGVIAFLENLESGDPEVFEVLHSRPDIVMQLTRNIDKIRERIAQGALEK